MSEINTILDLDTMMDMAMDSIETLPDFVTPPAGTYNLGINKAFIEEYQTKQTATEKAKKSTRIKILYAVDSTIELSSNEQPVKDGALFSEQFMGTSEGLKYFKRQAMNILNVEEESLKGVSLKEILAGLMDVHFKARITIKKSAKEGGGEYENVQVRPVHETPAVL